MNQIHFQEQYGADMMHKVTDLQPWECLMKRIVWKQLGN